MIVTVEKLDCGYVVRSQGEWPDTSHACVDIRSALQRVYSRLEGRAECFGGKMYGKVSIDETPPDQTKGEL